VFEKNRGVTSVYGEKRKVKCGKAHFDEFDGVEYRVRLIEE